MHIDLKLNKALQNIQKAIAQKYIPQCHWVSGSHFWNIFLQSIRIQFIRSLEWATNCLIEMQISAVTCASCPQHNRSLVRTINHPIWASDQAQEPYYCRKNINNVYKKNKHWGNNWLATKITLLGATSAQLEVVLPLWRCINHIKIVHLCWILHYQKMLGHFNPNLDQKLNRWVKIDPLTVEFDHF